MPYQNIRVEKEEQVARVIINRPPLNVLNIPTMWECHQALEELKDDPEVKAVIVTGSGDKAFCAGVDVADHTPDKMHQMIESFYAMFNSLINLDKPNVAVVNGLALGGGCEVVMVCDMVLATPRSKFGQPEITVGVYPTMANVLLPRLIPRKKALELILSGEAISAEEAWRVGLVNKVVPEEKLEEEAREFVKKFTTKSGAVLKWTRRSIYAAFDRSLADGLAEGDRLYFDELMQTEDANEGLRAFLEKRQPVWKDR